MSDKNIVEKSAEKFSEHYDENPLTALLLTTLSLAVPQISIGKEMIDRAVTKIQKECFQTLIDELAKGEKLLTPEIIETEEFIHSFLVVYRAALNTYQREKIRRFARILFASITHDELASDKFKSYVAILEKLTETDLTVLMILKELEDTHPICYITDEVTNKTFVASWDRWNSYEEKLIRQAKLRLDISENLLYSKLYQLQSTGLYSQWDNLFYVSSPAYRGLTTEMFTDFIDWINNNNRTAK